MGELKDQIMQRIRGVVKAVAKIITTSMLPIIAIIVAIVVLLSAIIYYITLEDGTYHEGDLGNTGYVVDETILSKFSVDNIVETSDGYKFDVDIDELVDEVIQTLQDNDGVLDKYISLANQKEYLKAFIMAEIITKYPDLRNADKIGTETADGEVQGCIKIYRSLPDGSQELLTYIDYDTFSGYITNGNETATHHFTLDSSGNLVVAGWTRITTNVDSNVDGVENVNNSVEYTLSTNSVNYQSAVSNYTMPFDFLWALTVAGRDEDFAYNVACLALESEMTITVYDNLTTTEVDDLEEYDIQEKEEKEAWITATIHDTTLGDISSSKQVELEVEDSPVYYYTHTNIKTERCTTTVQVTYADTWIATYTNEYINSIQDGTTNEEITEIDDTDYELVEEGTRSSDSDVASEASSYESEVASRYASYSTTSSYTTSSYGTVSYKKYQRTLNHKVTTDTITSYNSYTQRNSNSSRKNR